VLIGRLLNRYEIIVDPQATTSNPPDDGGYFFKFEENDNIRYMTYDVDKSTAELITIFMTDQGEKTALIDRLTSGAKYGEEALGACVGGGSLLKDQASYEVFDLSEGDTCSKK